MLKQNALGLALLVRAGAVRGIQFGASQEEFAEHDRQPSGRVRSRQIVSMGSKPPKGLPALNRVVITHAIRPASRAAELGQGRAASPAGVENTWPTALAGKSRQASSRPVPDGLPSTTAHRLHQRKPTHERAALSDDSTPLLGDATVRTAAHYSISVRFLCRPPVRLSPVPPYLFRLRQYLVRKYFDY